MYVGVHEILVGEKSGNTTEKTTPRKGVTEPLMIGYFVNADLIFDSINTIELKSANSMISLVESIYSSGYSYGFYNSGLGLIDEVPPKEGDIWYKVENIAYDTDYWYYDETPYTLKLQKPTSVGGPGIARKVKNAYLGIGNNRTYTLEETYASAEGTFNTQTESDIVTAGAWFDIYPINNDGSLKSYSTTINNRFLSKILETTSTSYSYCYVDFGDHISKYEKVTASALASVAARAPSPFNNFTYIQTKYILKPNYGATGTARKVKKGYVGVKTDFPIYEDLTSGAGIYIQDSNLSEYFTVTNGSYYFKWNSQSQQFIASNLGVNSSSSTTTLVAKKEIKDFSLRYGYTTEANYDKFTFKYNSTTVENAVSGTLSSKTWTQNLAVGDTLTFTYTKDSSSHATNETCYFENVTGVVQVTTQVQVGTKTKEVARLFYKSMALEDLTPSEIQEIVKSGQAANYWSVGDKIGIPINGTIGSLSINETYYAIILGFNHNSGVEGGNSIHFQLGKTAGGTDIAFADSSYDSSGSSAAFRMNTTNTNSGGWNGSYMRKTICPAFLAALPTKWQNVIVSCAKYSDNTGGGKNTASYVTATQDKIWLLSEFEVFGARNGANSAEQNYQKQYDYYKNGNSKVKYKHNNTGSACSWWLRSVSASGTGSFRLVYMGGYSSTYAAISYGFAPGFIIK